MSRTMFIRRNLQGPYPAGVPTPYAMHVHPYPTRFHGSVYTEPVFGFPWISSPQSVLEPGRDLYGMPYPRPGAQPVRGLGGNEADYPPMKYSDKTLALQRATNAALKTAGYCPVGEDGKLGPNTCVARALLNSVAPYVGSGTVFSAPDSCSSFVPGSGTFPKKMVNGSCGGGGSPTIATGPKPPATEASLGPGMFASMSSSTKKAMAFTVGSLVAIGAIYMLKKRSSTPRTA